MLVRGLSRNAFVNIPQYQQQDSQQQQYYWQLPPSQQQQSHSYHLNNSFEQQYQFQQQFLSKVQRRGVAGSQPDISRCSINNINNSSGANPASLAMTPLSPFSHLGGGGGGGGPPNSSTSSPHQVTIDMSPAAHPSATTSPQTTRRLLPRIITKKTDNSTVVLVGETRTPGKPPFNSIATAASPYSYPESLSTSYISAATGGGGGGWRPSECSINRNELSSSQILSHSPCAASTTTPKKTDSTDIVHKDHNISLVASGADGGVGKGGVPSLASNNATSKTTSASSHPPTKLISKGKIQKSCGATPTDSSTQQEKGTRNNKVQLRNVPSYISAHYRNAPITKLSHPLEENIFSSLFITLFAVAVAIIVGVPILCGVGIIVIGVVGIRYMIAILHGLASYMRFICSRWQHPTNSRSFPPKILPRDRLAFANDVRWLGKKRKSRCQSIIHTLLVFEGSMDVTTCRHLIQTRVLRAETPQGELAYPRLLQKLVSVTSGYLWELDLTFDIQNHIFSGPTYLKSEKQLQRYIGRLLVQELPLSRPLWEIRLLPSYYGSGKDTMAILRIHQCLADGMSLIRILSHSLADHQLMHVPQRPHFAGMSFGFNLLRSLIVGPLTIFLWWFTTFRDINIFSVPLPRLHKNRRRRRLWWSWLCTNPLKWFRGHASASFINEHGEDEEDKVSFTSSLGSSSSMFSSSDSSNDSDNGSEHSSHSVASGANKRRGKKFVQAFSNSPAQSSSKDDELTKGSSSNAQNSNQQNTPSHETTGSTTLHQDQGASSSKSTKSNQGFERILPRNLNKCFGKKLSTSKTSLQGQQELSGQGIKNELLTTGVAISGSGRTSDNTSGNRTKKSAPHKKKRKRRNGGHHHHHHRRRRLFGGGRKTSLASNSPGSSFTSSSSSSTGSSFSSPTSGVPSRPAAWNVVWSAPMTLPKVARVKQIMRSSYNDVLLSAAAGSIRMYMQDQGTPYPGDVQVVIPVDLRNDVASPKHSNRLGCKVSSVLATIPSGMESAIPRLWATRHRLDELKASADSVVAYGATTILMNMLPHRIAIPILESIVNKASLQFSNLPGPTSTVVIGGYPLKGIYPIYPPPGRLRAAISVLTYADQVHITVVTHRSLLNAGPKLMKGMTEQMEQLSRQLSQRRVPGESRRSTRNFNQGNAEITKPPTRQIHLQLQIVQEELAQLNSQLEAQGIVLSDEEYGFLTGSSGRRILSSLSQQHQQGLIIDSGAGGQYHHQHYHQHHHGHHPPHHHYHHHLPVSQEQTSSTGIEEPTPSTSQSTSMDLSPAGQIELQNRLKSLKNEFAQLIGELRRRSSIVEGIAMSFEDENEEEYRKPRKRALSVVSMTRRSSIFSSRSNATPDSPCYSSDDELPSSPQADSRHQPHSTGSGQIATSASSSSTGYPTPTPNIRHSTSPMRTTAV